jgi:hypothetical protein
MSDEDGRVLQVGLLNVTNSSSGNESFRREHVLVQNPKTITSVKTNS